MFEREITSGNHVSYHFCVDKFENNFHPKSKLFLIEKHLSHVNIDLSRYECNITTSNTTSSGDYFHISYLRKGSSQLYLSREVLEYFDININFPALYFTRKLPYESNYKCGFYLNTYKTFRSKFFDRVVKTISLFKGLYYDVFLAGDFNCDGKFIDESINIEIFPIPTKENFYAMKNILLDNFKVDKKKIDIYDNKFKNYTDNQFYFHIKIKFTENNEIVKFYRTYPNNPFLSYYDNQRAIKSSL